MNLEFASRRAFGIPNLLRQGLAVAGSLLAASSFAQSDYATPYAFTTLAGAVAAGSANGTGSAARFNHPAGVAVDSAGNVYVADLYNCTIRKITPDGVVTNLAGSPGSGPFASAGSADGTGSAAQFDQPSGVAVDSGGNVYVADVANSTIRKITPAGVVTTLAGTAGNFGSMDGTGGAAQFNEPVAVAVDSGGNVYVADGDQLVRKITPGGVVTTVGGPGPFRGLSGIAVDGAGNIYLVDSAYCTVSKMTPGGVVTTLAGTAGQFSGADGVGTAATFLLPEDVAVDGAGNLYVTDSGNDTIRKITPTVASGVTTWVVTTLAGTIGAAGSADGTGSAAQFNGPNGIAVDSGGGLYVADESNDTIRESSGAGSTAPAITTQPGSETVTAGGNASFTVVASGSPLPTYQWEVSTNGGSVFTALTDGGGVSGSTSATLTLTAAAAGLNGNEYQCVITNRVNSVTTAAVGLTVNGPPSLAIQPANATVAVSYNATFAVSGNISPAPAYQWKLSTNGGQSWTALTDGNGISGSATPTLSVDSVAAAQNGDEFEVVVTNSLGSATSVPASLTVEPDYAFITFAGVPPNYGSVDATGAAAQFNAPQGAAVDSAGNVYVADAGNDTIRKITPAGVVTTIAGTPGVAGSADGTGGAAQFYGPAGVAVDSGGNVYVADQANGTIREITPTVTAGVTTWTVTTLAGTPYSGGSSGSADGTGGAAQFDRPGDVAVDGAGNLYVADTYNNTIRQITPTKVNGVTTWVVTTLAGTAGTVGHADGTGAAASFYDPTYVTVGSGTGIVYVTDSSNDTIREITPTTVSGITTWAVTTLAGLAGGPFGFGFEGSADGAGSAARFNFPNGLAVDGSGNVYVADSDNDTIRKITPAGAVSTLAGAALNPRSGTELAAGDTDGTGSAARFYDPIGLAIDGSGNLYVADSANDTVRKIAPGAVVTTLAGAGGSVGFADGAGSAARFFGSQGMAVDGAGNVYVADTPNDTIRKITPGGVVTTFAGTADTPGTADGTGTAAQFNQPVGLALDSSGNLYVGDSKNATIRMITPAGVVTTLAGTPGFGGNMDGVGNGAEFAQPRGIALDRAGNIYVADFSNDSIREVSPTVAGGVTTWSVTTLAGGFGFTDGAGNINYVGGGSLTGVAGFDGPAGVAVDGSGNVFVVSLQGAIRELTPSVVAGYPIFVVSTPIGTLSKFATTGTADGTDNAAQFGAPEGVTADSGGNLYVADSANDTIRKVAPTLVSGIAQVVTTLAGTAGGIGSADGTGGAAQFFYPLCTAVDGAGNIYVADTGNCTIRRITPAGVTTTLAGTPSEFGGASDGTGTAAQFSRPSGVAVDRAGNIYVADTDNNAIREITPTVVSGVTTWVVTTIATGFNGPFGVAVDSLGNLYVTDRGNNTVRKITPTVVSGVTTWAVATLAGLSGSMGTLDGTGAAARFDSPAGIAVDGAGNVYVADASNDTLRKIAPNGVVTTLAGAPGSIGGMDGTGGAAQFDSPSGVAVDGAGNIYVADTQDELIRKITPSGAVSTLAGIVTTQFGPLGLNGSADGIGRAAQFNQPEGVAVDGAGDLYVADTYNGTIRKITPTAGNVLTWVTTTVAGQALVSGRADGAGAAAGFFFPEAVAVDSADNLYVADADNNTIRKGGPATSGFSSPPITKQPEGQTLNSGSTVVFTGAASGASSYQWYLNGVPLANSGGSATTDVISGATGPQLVITHATAASNGSYTLVATNSGGQTTSSAAVLAVSSSANPGLATSISTRAFVGTGDNILIGGFYIVGSTSRTVLVQALGPALAPLGVSGALQHPELSIHQSQNGHDVTLYSNTGWSTNTGVAEQQVLLAAAASAFATPVLVAGSADSELLLTLPPGGYSAEVGGADGGTGVALCAIYELP